MYALPVRRLKEILSRLLPDLTLSSVEETPSSQLARLYTLMMSDGNQKVLSYAPSLTVRLLRHEASMLADEAALIQYLTSADHAKPEASQSSTSMAPIIRLVPKLLRHSSDTREMAHPYSIFEPAAGAPLSTESVYLTATERRAIDKQVGSLTRALASLTSPNGLFGAVNRVLPRQNIPGAPTPRGELGLKTWSEAFNILLEHVLRDGEDMAVLIPYESVRSHYRRVSWYLDAITQPRLFILDAGSESNILVERKSEGGASSEPEKKPKMTGLRSWSLGIFGDPLLCNCFEEASEGFSEGWEEGGEDITEDAEHREVRVLMYRCFQAIASLVTEYYRPRGDSSRRELDARRKLTSALAELERVDMEIPREKMEKRARSQSRNIEVTAKRPKIEGE